MNAGTVLLSTTFPVATSLVIIWYAIADGTGLQESVIHVGPAWIILKKDGGGRLQSRAPVEAGAGFEGSMTPGTACNELHKTRKSSTKDLLSCAIIIYVRV